MTDFGAELHRFLAEGGISLSAAAREAATPLDGLAVQFQGAVPAAMQETGQQLREAGRQELVGAAREAGVGPPLIAEHALLFAGGVLEPEPGCGLTGVAEVGRFATVVVAPVAEPGLAHPQARAELVQDDPGFLGEFAAGRLLCRLVGVDAAAGQFPPVVGEVIRVARVDEQDTVVRVEQEHARPKAQFCCLLGGVGHGRLVSGRGLAGLPCAAGPGSKQRGRRQCGSRIGC